jgi:hypothetical protein
MLTPYDLVYSDEARCSCGEGLAYVRTRGKTGWTCSALLLLQYDESRKHADGLTYHFIKPETAEQSTRPGPVQGAGDDAEHVASTHGEPHEPSSKN